MPSSNAHDFYAGRQHSSKPVIFNIGEVLAQLTQDFPLVTASKIRFFEEKGLITPQRTAAGYRQFAPSDVERLRFVLALQRDHYLPLKVIRDYLEAIDRGEGPENLPPGVSATIAPRAVSAELTAEQVGRSRRLSLDELRAESGASLSLIESLLSFGLITAEHNKFDDVALKVTKSCAALAAHGIEARHLRLFQVAARREFDLIEQATQPLSSRRDGAATARAAESAREIGELCLGLHSALVHGLIARMDK